MHSCQQLCLEINRNTNLFHCSNGIHLVIVRAETFNFDADVGALFDNLITIVGPVGWRGVGVKLDLGGYHLEISVFGPESMAQELTYVATNERLQRAAIHKET
jgi:hypothetical protein